MFENSDKFRRISKGRAMVFFVFLTEIEAPMFRGRRDGRGRPRIAAPL
jgi:hypothetical protein